MNLVRRCIAFLVCILALGPTVGPVHAADTTHSYRAHDVVAGPLAKPTKLVKIGTLSIPRLRLRMPIYRGITMNVFDAGMGYWPGTAKPGQLGNMVIGGHRTGGSMALYHIDKMRSGDTIVVTARGKTYRYKVTGHRIVKPKDVWITKQSRRARTLTLFACHPLHSIAKRYIVSAVLVQ